MPELHAYALDADGDYRLVANVRGDEVFVTEVPFPVTIRPSDLLRRRS